MQKYAITLTGEITGDTLAELTRILNKYKGKIVSYTKKRSMLAAHAQIQNEFEISLILNDFEKIKSITGAGMCECTQAFAKMEKSTKQTAGA